MARNSRMLLSRFSNLSHTFGSKFRALSPPNIFMEKTQENSYNETWFKNRAFNSIRPIDTTHWDYSDSLLLYIPGSEGDYQAIQTIENPYYEAVTKPEREYLQSIASKVVGQLPRQFDYVDLGPGTEHKEQFIFDAAKEQNKKFTYIPVDINNKFLELAENYAGAQGIPTQSIHTSFEELVHKLPSNNIPRLVSLGLTYTNYAPQEILRLLKDIAGKKGYIFIDTQIRDRVDMGNLVKIYSQDGYFISAKKLQLIDLGREDVETHVDDGIRVWATLKNSTPQLIQKGIKAGATLLLFQSRRNTVDTFEEEIKKSSKTYTLFDTGATFVGALIRTE